MSRLFSSRRPESFGGRESQLPGLQTSRRTKPKVSTDDINQIKIQNQEMETEIRQLRSKTHRMKQLLNDRNNSIKQALSSAQEHPPLQTASLSTINQLKSNIQILKNTLSARQEEVDELEVDDRTAVSDELQAEILLYHAEHSRLTIQNNAVNDGLNLLAQEKDRLIQEIKQTTQNKALLIKTQAEIDELASKLHAYRASMLRNEAAEICAECSDNPQMLKPAMAKLQDEINSLDQQIIEQEAKISELREKETEIADIYRQKIADCTQK